jgi:hypothetical protein
MRIFPDPTDVVAEIEARQDDLLRRLDDLNIQVERALAEHGKPPGAAEAVKDGRHA